MATVIGSQQPVKIGIRILRGQAVFYAESDQEQLFAQTFETIEDALLAVEESLLLHPETKTELLAQAAFLLEMN